VRHGRQQPPENEPLRQSEHQTQPVEDSDEC
jgi:hypothetical protein